MKHVETSTECQVCLADCLDSAGLDTGAICQCAEGHVLCAACFEARGGGAGLCAICKVPTGVIRSRALQSLRDLNASQRWRAGDASPVKTSAGAGAAGASDTGKARADNGSGSARGDSSGRGHAASRTEGKSLPRATRAPGQSKQPRHAGDVRQLCKDQIK